MSGGKGGVKSIGFGGPKHITFNIKHPQKLSNNHPASLKGMNHPAQR
jgi:hypothetical protein